MGASRVLVGVVASLALLAAAGSARAQDVGDVGESCRARSDCREGLRCLENTCQEPAATPAGCQADGDCEAGQTCRDGACAAADQAGASEPEEEGGQGEQGPESTTPRASSGPWVDFELEGTHFFAGLTFAPGLTGYWPYGGDLPVWASFFFSLRAGVLFSRTELSMEIAPLTWFWDFAPEDNLQSLSFLVNIGGLIRMADHVYWPFRFGLGLSAHDLPITPVYMQGRLDLIGLVYQHGHLLFEVNLPSIRFSSEFRNMGLWAWLFTLSISYVV